MLEFVFKWGVIIILSEITKSNSHANLYGRHLELSLFKLILGIFLISCDKLQIVVFLNSRRVPDIGQEMLGLPWHLVPLEAFE
jgi:hypothetical protein